ncbi:hypothetical protein [Planomonospora algeriensis]
MSAASIRWTDGCMGHGADIAASRSVSGASSAAVRGGVRSSVRIIVFPPKRNITSFPDRSL